MEINDVGTLKVREQPGVEDSLNLVAKLRGESSSAEQPAVNKAKQSDKNV